MALTVTVNSRKTVHRDEVLTTGKVNAVGLPTVTVGGTAETANIADNAVTPAKAEYGAWHWASATGTNQYTLTTGNSLSGTPETGEVVAWKVPNANTGSVDVTVDSYSQANVKRKTGLELVQDDLALGQVVEMRFDGSDWQLLTPVANNEVLVGEDAGSTDAYAFTAAPTLVAYREGLEVIFKANTANSGACTLNISSIGAIAIKKQKDQALATGDIKAGQWVKLVYDGTNFQMISPGGQGDDHAAPGTNSQLVVALHGSNPTYQLDVDADFLSLTDATGALKLLTGVDLTLDVTLTDQQNGTDEGAEAATAWYYAYVCYDQATAATFGLLSTQSNPATGPSTANVAFTHWALAGVVRNESGDFASTASLRQGVWYFQSDAQQVAASTNTFTWAHPFSRKPMQLLGVAVCDATEGNYAEGDEIPIEHLLDSAAASWTAVLSVATTSDLNLMQHYATLRTFDKTSMATGFNLTAAKWSLKIYAQF